MPYVVNNHLPVTTNNKFIECRRMVIVPYNLQKKFTSCAALTKCIVTTIFSIYLITYDNTIYTQSKESAYGRYRNTNTRMIFS